MLSPTHPMQLVLGPTVWAAWFVVLYGGLSVACAVAPPASELGMMTWLNGVLLMLTLGTVAVLVQWAGNCWKAAPAIEAGSVRRFIARVSAGAHLIAAITTLAVGLTTLALPPCV